MSKPAPVALFFFALLPCFASLASAPPEIPFRFTDGFIRIEAQVEGAAKPLSMLLDSGASVSMLNLATARRLRLETGKRLSVRGVASNSSACEIVPVQANVRGWTCGSLWLAADMSRASELCGEPIDGLIGIDFFKDRVVQIDYARQCLRLLPRSPQPATALRLPLRIINDVVCVNVGVNGSSARWTRLDTGCNDALHWVIPKTARSGKSHSASVGFVTDTRDVVPARVSLGERVLHSVPTALHGRPFFEGEAGLVGNALLSRFTVTIDWPGGCLILEDRSD